MEYWVLKEALGFKLQEQYVRGVPRELTLTNCVRGPELAGPGRRRHSWLASPRWGFVHVEGASTRDAPELKNRPSACAPRLKVSPNMMSTSSRASEPSPRLRHSAYCRIQQLVLHYQDVELLHRSAWTREKASEYFCGTLLQLVPHHGYR